MRISISVHAEKVLGALRKWLGKGWMPIFLTVIATHLIGNDGRGLKHYTPYKHVSRKQAYGVTFFSDKQRRWWWANQPSIPYRRTGEQGKAWMLEGVRGSTATIANRKKSVLFTRGQTALHNLMGWPTAMAQVSKDLPAAVKRGVQALRAWIGL
jgi:hypothetical protein